MSTIKMNNYFENAWKIILKNNSNIPKDEICSWIKELCRNVTVYALDRYHIEHDILYCNHCNKIVTTHNKKKK